MLIEAPGGTRRHDSEFNALCVAADGGARATLAPIAAFCGRTLPVTSAATASVDHWARLIVDESPRLLIVGTSDSHAGRSTESAARRAARDAHLRIAAIEDFPGNHYSVPDAEADLVIVESAAARDICAARLGAIAPRIEIANLARYDSYRAQLGALRARTSSQWMERAGERYRVLWAGQPDTDDCVRTLRTLAPHLRARNVELLFKAHPRDSGYATGDYARTLEAAGVSYVDLTSASQDEALAWAPDLVVTQFSSLSIEAGFYGIPSLWLLLPDAGGARLAASKGYRVPPLIAAGAGALASTPADIPEALGRALADATWRTQTIRLFDAYWKVGELAAPRLVERLLRFV